MARASSTVVRKVRAGRFRGMVVVDSAIDHFLRGDGNVEELFRNSSSRLKSDRWIRSAIVELPASALAYAAREELLVKEFRRKHPLHSLKFLFKPHRAQLLWEVSWYLLQRGICVPEPVGYLLKQKGPLCIGGYFFCRILKGYDSLGNLAKDMGRLRLESRALTETLARGIASLHNNGVAHGDLKWWNILIHREEEGLCFVDLDAATVYGSPLAPAQIARDLARFVLQGLEVGLDQEIIDRFLDEYASKRELTRQSIDRPMKKALAKFQKRHQRQRKS